MRLQTTNEGLSNLDRALGYTLAAFSMFVVGYTATRAFLNQPQGITSGSEEIVIPHQAAMWSDFAN